jgi:hypothetical protein
MANHLPVPVELTDAELDAVTGGQGNGVAFGAGGLAGVAAGVGVSVQDFLNNTLDNNSVANNNHVVVGVGAAIAVLGGAANGLHLT